MNTIFDEVMAERARQDAQWGGHKHDDGHGYADWMLFRQKFEALVLRAPPMRRRQVARDSLIKIAALAVAQIESIDRQTQEKKP